ncbi:hypothetical protein ACE6H2_000631 [Prunus campanulata]
MRFLSQPKMGFATSPEEEDQFRPITPIRVVVPKLRPLNNAKEDEDEDEELLLLEGDVHEHEECHTPKSPAAHVTLKQPPVCPPAPKKPTQARRKLRPRPSQGFFKVPDDLTSVFMAISSSSNPAKKKMRAS